MPKTEIYILRRPLHIYRVFLGVGVHSTINSLTLGHPVQTSPLNTDTFVRAFLSQK